MKKLGFYKYAPALLEDWDHFHFYDFKEKTENNVPLLYFKWSFREFAGYGEIYYDAKTKTVRNSMGDNFSIMHITNLQLEEIWNLGLKHYSPLYNEPGLEEVFNKILNTYFAK